MNPQNKYYVVTRFDKQVSWLGCFTVELFSMVTIINLMRHTPNNIATNPSVTD